MLKCLHVLMRCYGSALYLLSQVVRPSVCLSRSGLSQRLRTDISIFHCVKAGHEVVEIIFTPCPEIIDTPTV